MVEPTEGIDLSVLGHSQVFLGGDPSLISGALSGLDAVQAYDLRFDAAAVDPRGYHVMLTVAAPGAVGSDVKEKTFWVAADSAGAPQGADADQSAQAQPLGLVRGGGTTSARTSFDTFSTTGAYVPQWARSPLAFLGFGLAAALGWLVLLVVDDPRARRTPRIALITRKRTPDGDFLSLL